MKKVFLGIIIALLATSLILITTTAIRLNNNIKENKKVVDYINSLNLNFVENIDQFDYYPKYEIFKKDYVGIINVGSLGISLPVRAKCNNKNQAVCMYKEKNLTIIATNLLDSFHKYKEIDVDEIITFDNFWGTRNVYRVDKIIHKNNIDNLEEYENNLILVIKDYFKMEYIIYLCN